MRPPTPAIDETRLLEMGRQVLNIEGLALLALQEQLSAGFTQACHAILRCQGRVVVSGMGKSGHIGRKLAATLASTGTPAFFVHPAEAIHGDLGMITAHDVLLAISNSGETDEFKQVMPVVKRQGATMIAMTAKPESTMARLADIVVLVRVEKEACPLNLAPTASTTAALAMGDALAVAVLDARGFKAEDFARSHPGGTLGRRLLTFVADVMRVGPDIPQVALGTPFGDAMLEMTRKRMGMTAIVSSEGQIAGIFTDGDLRRVLNQLTDFVHTPIDAVMTRAPRTIEADRMAVEAVGMMEKHQISQLLVADRENRLVGVLNLHDLMQAKVV